MGSCQGKQSGGDSGSLKPLPAKQVITSNKKDGNGKPLVFLSYSWRYRKLDVQRLAKQVLYEQPDFEVWLDVDNMPGDFIYKAMSDAIDRAKLVVVFFSRPYPTPASNSMREFEYALSEGKPMLLVQLDPAYRPEGAFKLAVGSRLYFKYREGEQFFEEDGANIVKQIRELLAEPLVKSKSTGEEKKFRFLGENIPKFVGPNVSLPDLEVKLVSNLISCCNEPHKGAMALLGQSIFEKAKFVAWVLNDLMSKEFVERLNEPTQIFWINCRHWQAKPGDAMNRQQLVDFEDSVLEDITKIVSDFDGYEIASVGKFYRKAFESHVLLVIDGAEDLQLLKLVTGPGTNSKKENRVKMSFCVLVESLDKFGAVSSIFNQSLMLDFDQHDATAGLESLKLSEPEQQSLHAFALFKPGGNVSTTDLAMIDSNFENTSRLLQKLETSTGILVDALHPSEKSYAIHPSILDKMQLAECQRKVIFPGKGKMVLFGIVKKCQRRILNLILANCDSDLLLEIALAPCQTPETGDTFIHFLYKFNEWPDRHKFDPDHDGIAIWSLNHSYGIILERFLRRFQLENRRDCLEKLAINCTNFMADLLEQEEKPAFRIHRGYLLNLLRPWRYLAENHFWIRFNKQKAKRANVIKQIEAGSKIGVKSELWIAEAAVRTRSPIFEDIFQAVLSKKREADDEAGQDDEEDENEAEHAKKAWEKIAESQLNPFLISAQLGYTETIKKMAELSSWEQLLTEKDRMERNALWYAASSGHFELAKMLIGKGAVARPDIWGITPLLAASANGGVEMVELLEGHGEGHSEVDDDTSKPERGFDLDGHSKLYYAAEGGHLELLRCFAEKEPSLVHRCSRIAKFPMMAAVGFGHFDVVRYLAEKDPEQISKGMNTGAFPLWMACERGDFQLARFLAKKEPDLVTEIGNNFRKHTPLWIAAHHGHLRIVKMLNDLAPQTISVVDVRNVTPLLSAAELNQTETCCYLAKMQPSLITQLSNDRAKQNALHMSVTFGNEHLARFLVDQCPKDRYHALLESSDGFGKTALFIAAERGHRNLVEYLLGLVPKHVVKKAGSWGHTPASVAAHRGHDEICEIIKAHLSKVSSQDDN